MEECLHEYPLHDSQVCWIVAAAPCNTGVRGGAAADIVCKQALQLHWPINGAIRHGGLDTDIIQAMHSSQSVYITVGAISVGWECVRPVEAVCQCCAFAFGLQMQVQ